MADQRATDLSKARNIIGLFQYLEPMWIVSSLKILEDLLADGTFYPNRGTYQAELRQAGINVDRMTIIMDAVMFKAGRSVTFRKFMEMDGALFFKLPAQQQKEIREFWLAGPKPGLEGPGDEPAPEIGNSGDWFVTNLSGQTESVTVVGGFSVFQGSIDFSRANGNKYGNAMACFGPAIGISYGGKEAAAGAGKLSGKFPGLAKAAAFLDADAKIAEWVLGKAPAALRAILDLPRIKIALKALNSVKNGGSFGPAAAPSWAKGFVWGSGTRVLGVGDFAGSCVVFAVTGSAIVSGEGIYIVFFGLPSWWNPLTDPWIDQSKGFALIGGFSAYSLQIPSLGAAASIMWGEIV